VEPARLQVPVRAGELFFVLKQGTIKNNSEIKTSPGELNTDELKE
jgi:hypothetical protein